MREYLDKYKYHIGGTSIAFIIFYLLYDSFSKTKLEETSITFKEDKKEVVKAEISHEEFLLFMKTLKHQLQNLTQSMMQFNANNIKTHSKYKDFRDKLFTKDIVKKSILIDSVSVNPENPENTSNYVVNFGTDIYGEVFKNVIGFRLVKATVPHTAYTIDDNNTTIVFNNGSDSSSDVTVTLIPGSYTFKGLGNHLQTQINASALSGFSVSSNLGNLKYTISHSSSFSIKWTNSVTGLHKIFGFNNSDTTSSASHTSDNAADQTKHFIDLVIPEIPSIACKMGSKKQVIDRIPLNSPSGSLVYYRSPEGELQTHNYFYPMKLSSLNIQLYDNDSTNLYSGNGGHNYFEFEITIVKNTELFK
jgi:hypothetical protein